MNETSDTAQPEYLFWIKNGTDHAPNPACSQHWETIFIRIAPGGPRSEPAPPKLPDIPPLLQRPQSFLPILRQPFDIPAASLQDGYVRCCRVPRSGWR